MTRVVRQPQLALPEVRFSARFGLFDETVLFETNDESLLEAASASFGRFPVPGTSGRPAIAVRIFLDLDEPSAGMNHRIDRHVYLIGSGPDVATVDCVAGTAVAFVSPQTLADVRLLRYSFIEGLPLAALYHSRGYLALHACGLSRDGVGVAVMGAQGAGKSTLAVAAARRGLGVFAEDAAFVRAGPAGLEFWGLPWSQRLLLDAVRFFPELAGLQPARQPNGELKLEIDLDEYFPGRATPSAVPGAVVLLERGGASAGLSEVPPDTEIPTLWAWGDHWTAAHDESAALLAELPVFRLELGGSPDEALVQLDRLFEDLAGRSHAR